MLMRAQREERGDDKKKEEWKKKESERRVLEEKEANMRCKENRGKVTAGEMRRRMRGRNICGKKREGMRPEIKEVGRK